MVVTFDREKLEPLLYNVGDKIMGYYTGHGAWILVAGKIVEAKQSTNCMYDNDYTVELIPELLDDSVEQGITFHLPEKEARPFDEVRALQAVKHWKNEMRLRAEASQEHIEMLKLLYPENYIDKKQEK